MGEPEDVKEEVKHVKKVPTVNGYKKCSFQIPQKKVREGDQQTDSPTANKEGPGVHPSTSLGCQNSYKECSGLMAYHHTTNLSTP